MEIGWRDPVSSGTHLFGAICGVVITLFMTRFTRSSPRAWWTFLVYGLSMVILYSASASFHAVQGSPEKIRLFQRIDQSAIYLLIFGTCTPMILLTFRTIWGPIFLGMIGAVGLIGILANWLLPKPSYPILVSTYVVMGFLGAIGSGVYRRETSGRALWWLFGGAAAYLAGAIFDVLRWPTLVPGWIHSHEILHICDLLGTWMHFVFLASYVWPAYAKRPRPPMPPPPSVASNRATRGMPSIQPGSR
ncbi:PAQR family membrane homeostasis protein TrhA [Tuwongella immobilis]|uniref:Uncharacterized protein n=1 Tax=Tuwongella immobilis TaxID=692036 RepID=A0A6C2YIP6_9BACT|nr:hemolysin III family protein [Tuwongella immobilis]VIP01151.1 hemolysin iii : Channel protein, hemolysin III family OS=Clostridium sporogenes ATCC 15579 GN=CLOSPO_03344 PE=4 SV=1: HlyIII [Tuwongella immobilis]VTR97728.1 hemolysin iii : Channel protein, hemolysin III family OS=Clostridium sporogenes ATCC 15579 GN=CLOSPO_03344 PE=4 SV=1: HlyIII [Tuwongella immobilis]